MKHLITALFLIALAGCGFQPVHSPRSTSLSAGNISVPEIPGRSGHMLRKALIAELATGLPGIEAATLVVTLDEDLNRLAIRPDEAAARTDIIARGRYVLDTGETAISGGAQAETSFNVPVATFADIASQTDASERAMIVLAQRIADDLRLKLATLK